MLKWIKKAAHHVARFFTYPFRQLGHLFAGKKAYSHKPSHPGGTSTQTSAQSYGQMGAFAHGQAEQPSRESQHGRRQVNQPTPPPSPSKTASQIYKVPDYQGQARGQQRRFTRGAQQTSSRAGSGRPRRLAF